MPAKKKQIKRQSHITVVDEIRDYGNDPYFKKKDERAKAFLEKNPLPKEFLKKRK
jgi:hypothetical protein